MQILKNALLALLMVATVGIWFAVNLKVAGIAEHAPLISSHCSKSELKQQLKIEGVWSDRAAECWRGGLQ